MIHFTDFFRLPPDTLESYGAYNVSLLSDLPVFIDPFLLYASPNPRYRQQHEAMIRYLKFLRDEALAHPLSDEQLRAWGTFPEVPENWMGFCREGNRGKGLGLDFARSLEKNFKTVFNAFGSPSIPRDSHIEELALLEDGIARDYISDYTMNLAKPLLLNFSEEFARLHLKPSQRRVVTVEKVSFDYGTKTWQDAKYMLPYVHGRHVILVPKDILTRDLAWINRKDMEEDLPEVLRFMPDDERKKRAWAYYTQLIPDEATATEVQIGRARRQVYAHDPLLIEYYVRYKETRTEDARNRSSAFLAQADRIFRANANELRKLLQSMRFYSQPGDTIQGARQRLTILKRAVEERGADQLFYLDGKPLRRLDDLSVLRRLIWLAGSREPGDTVSIAKIVSFRFAGRSDLKSLVAATGAEGPAIAIFAFTDEELRRAQEVVRQSDPAIRPNLFVIDTRLTGDA